MAGMCFGIVGDSDASPVEPSTIGVRRHRMMEIVPSNIMAADISIAPPMEIVAKRQKLSVPEISLSREFKNASGSFSSSSLPPPPAVLPQRKEEDEPERTESAHNFPDQDRPKFGSTSVRGRRREMEDTVSIHPFLCGTDKESSEFHFYGVFDGHGCSHVAMRCKARMHAIIKEEIEKEGGSVEEWEPLMKRSFERMDKEVAERPDGLQSCCRCELQSPQCDAVGSTAVVALVTPDKIIVSNTGDSRAILSRGGVAVPLSSDHKPDRPDELERIQAAGGRVIYWDGARVLGVLAMSRAIGDNYLKPYVIPEPEVTVTQRDGASCLILASDGLWDVVSNETATGVARMCLSADRPSSTPQPEGVEAFAGESSDQGCLDASMLLTKLALARHSADNVSVVVVDLRSKDL
ncbi:hypothetical protein V2J09_023370 [Rumex salicifolius]